MLIGRLGAAPEQKTFGSGKSCVRFPLATSRGHGEGRQTDWHRVTVFGKLGDMCVQYLQKGELCYVEGRVEYRELESAHGTSTYTQIVANNVSFLGTGKRAGGQSEDGESMPF
jgi:single-strand DNA-binding protein